MSEVRRDHKGRKLLNGESQRKDGKYEYKYQDARGRRKTVYSWKLTPADRVPAGYFPERKNQADSKGLKQQYHTGWR